MKTESPAESRSLREIRHSVDLVIVGGGYAGTCAAITAARHGLKVVLAQDRPVLGGNGSSEVRLWGLGATSHMGNNNRWAREGGVINEVVVENLWRNPEGNPYIFDTILLEMTVAEPNITLLLNTAVYEAQKSADGSDKIESVTAFCAQNSTQYYLEAPLFCDASGDGILGFLSGAAFRMGAESTSEFGERFAPSEEYGELLGHSLYFYTKDTGKPVRFVPPAYALSDLESRVPRFRSFNTQTFGCRLWWIEYGGRLDTVHETETIKWELWKVVYGVWDYIKNSGKFPDSANLTLEWVGAIPGKRESRRFEGDYMLRQQDIIDQTDFPDVAAFGGWSIDLHPADGVFSERPGCNQWHSRGIFGIPYRSYYSRNITNLFLAGRIVSASHVAFGSTRVMMTCAHGAQAVAAAASLCVRDGLLPRDIGAPDKMAELQKLLLRDGQHLPNRVLSDPSDLAKSSKITASSRLQLGKFSDSGDMMKLDSSFAMLLPLAQGMPPAAAFMLDVAEPTELTVEFRTSTRADGFTPDNTRAVRRISLAAGDAQQIEIAFADVHLDESGYGFYCLIANPAVSVHLSNERITGVLALSNHYNPAVASGARQTPPSDIGVESFEFWCPQRRPNGRNAAMTLSPALDGFGPENVVNGVQRPTHASNAWVADLSDPLPTLTLQWDRAQSIRQIVLTWDTDWDHAMETVLMGHPESVAPFCVRYFRILDGSGKTLAEVAENHQTRSVVTLSEPCETDKIVIECTATWGGANVPAALFEVRCYASVE